MHENIVAMPQFHPSLLRREGGFGWAEILGEARINSRPIARYLVMISAAAVIAALGVITSNTILIVGAMAVSPDLLPICATCVGLVNHRFRLAGRACDHAPTRAGARSGDLSGIDRLASCHRGHRRRDDRPERAGRPCAYRLLHGVGRAGGRRGGDDLVRDQGERGRRRRDLRDHDPRLGLPGRRVRARGARQGVGSARGARGQRTAAFGDDHARRAGAAGVASKASA